jgi:hypothetical protein
MTRKQATQQAASSTPSTTASPRRRPAKRGGHSDVAFLQSWASGLNYSAASVLRAGQIRRTNPELVSRITSVPRD